MKKIRLGFSCESSEGLNQLYVLLFDPWFFMGLESLCNFFYSVDEFKSVSDKKKKYHCQVSAEIKEEN